MLRMLRRRRRDLRVRGVRRSGDRLSRGGHGRSRSRAPRGAPHARATAAPATSRRSALTIELTGRLTHRRRRRPRPDAPAPSSSPSSGEYRNAADPPHASQPAMLRFSQRARRAPPERSGRSRVRSRVAVRAEQRRYARLAPANAVSFQNGSAGNVLRPVRHVQVGLGVRGVAGRRAERATRSRRLVADVDAEVEVLGPELCPRVDGAGRSTRSSSSTEHAKPNQSPSDRAASGSTASAASGSTDVAGV